IVIDNLADRRICVRRDLDKIEPLLLRHPLCILRRIDAYFDVIADKPYLRHPDHVVGTVFLLLFLSESWIKTPSPGRSWSRWKCHLLVLSPAAVPGGNRKLFFFFYSRPQGLGTRSEISRRKSAMNSSIPFTPRSPLPWRRTATFRSVISFSPTTSI